MRAFSGVLLACTLAGCTVVVQGHPAVSTSTYPNDELLSLSISLRDTDLQQAGFTKGPKESNGQRWNSKKSGEPFLIVDNGKIVQLGEDKVLVCNLEPSKVGHITPIQAVLFYASMKRQKPELPMGASSGPLDFKGKQFTTVKCTRTK